MKGNIKCPYCESIRLQIIGGKLIENGRSKGRNTWRSEVEYMCLEDNNHIFKTVKQNYITSP